MRQALQHSLHPSIDLIILNCFFFFLQENSREFEELLFLFLVSEVPDLSQDFPATGIELFDFVPMDRSKKVSTSQTELLTIRLPLHSGFEMG